MGLFDSGYSDVMAGTPRLSGRGAVPARSFGQLLSLLGEPLPGGDELQTSAMYRAGLLDAMAGGPTQGEFREGMRNKMANTALGLLGAIEPLYHGSPHKFSKFDLSKIGSGEGAQAYGHGAYLAESPGVAKSYAEQLARQKADVMYRGNVFSNKYGPEHTVRQLLAQGQTPQEIAENAAKARAEFKASGDGKEADFWNAVSKLGNKLQTEQLQVKQADANLYEARLRWPDAAREASDPLGPQHFLDWDKPLSEQGEAVQSAVKKATGISNEKAWIESADAFPRVVTDTEKIKQLNLLAITNPKYVADEGYKFVDPFATMTGKDLHYMLGGRAIESTGKGEEALKAVGIPGIRYLDAGSRGAGAGTHNYVVFDDALIELFKRNGEAIGGLLGGK
jgi:hypothetical protein